MKYVHIGVGNHTARRSPCGERGLKCAVRAAKEALVRVAPRAGSVD